MAKGEIREVIGRKNLRKHSKYKGKGEKGEKGDKYFLKYKKADIRAFFI